MRPTAILTRLGRHGAKERGKELGCQGCAQRLLESPARLTGGSWVRPRGGETARGEGRITCTPLSQLFGCPPLGWLLETQVRPTAH